MEELDLKELFNMFWKKKTTIILITLIFAIIGCIYSFCYLKPQYKSKTKIVLTKKDEDNKIIAIVGNDEGITQSDLDINSKLIKTYGELVKSESIIEKVIDNLKLTETIEEIKNMISVNTVTDTDIIEISVRNLDAVKAKDITNELSNKFIERVKEIYNIENLYIVDEAKVSGEPFNINHIKDIIIFTFVGIVLSVGYILVANLFKDTIKNASEIETKIGLNVLLEVPKMDDMMEKGRRREELIMYEDPKNVYADTIKKLRTRLQHVMNEKNTKTLLVTSTIQGEGKSFIAANLATSFAQIGYKVALIDADMRKGRQYKIFKILKEPGLANYLSGKNEYGKPETDKEINKYLQPTFIENLSLLSSGTTSINSSELLSGEKFKNVIEELSKTYDILIFDGTPSSIVTDAVVISKMVGVTILIEEVNTARPEDILKTKKDIEEVKGKIAGVVLNKTDASKRSYQYSYRYYLDDSLPTATVTKRKKEQH